jgi:hypothetical protein
MIAEVGDFYDFLAEFLSALVLAVKCPISS